MQFEASFSALQWDARGRYSRGRLMAETEERAREGDGEGGVGERERDRESVASMAFRDVSQSCVRIFIDFPPLFYQRITCQYKIIWPLKREKPGTKVETSLLLQTLLNRCFIYHTTFTLKDHKWKHRSSHAWWVDWYNINAVWMPTTKKLHGAFWATVSQFVAWWSWSGKHKLCFFRGQVYTSQFQYSLQISCMQPPESLYIMWPNIYRNLNGAAV